MKKDNSSFNNTGALWKNTGTEWNADFTGVISIDGVERKIHAKRTMTVDESLDAGVASKKPYMRIFVLPECM
jgi:hypothetical protein